jgi:ATP-binding cassette, subfamily B, bacterial CvaB/MchF/RaxB
VDVPFAFRKRRPGIDDSVAKTPLILQSAASECGLACLAMVLGAVGETWSLGDLRERFSTSSRGTTLRRMLDIATSLSLIARPLRVELEYTPQLQLPCILHWGLMHYVVLVAVHGDSYVIHDPASGRRTVGPKDFSRMFTGVAIEFERTPGVLPPHRSKTLTWRSFFGKVMGIRGDVFAIVVGALLLELLQVLAPFYLQWTVDWVLTTGDLGIRKILLLAFALVLVITIAVSAMRTEVILRLRSRLHRAWLIDTFQHLLRLPASFFERRYLGDLAARFDGISYIQKLLTGSFFEIGLDGLMSAVLLLVMLRYSRTLVAISCCSIVCAILIRRLLMRPLRDYLRSYEVLHAIQQGYVLETVKSIQSIKLFSGEGVRLGQWANLVVRGQNRMAKSERIQALFRLSNTLVFGGERLLVLWYATSLVLQHEISIGMLFSYIAYRELLAARVMNVLDKYLEIKTIEIHLDRLSDIVMAPAESSADVRTLPPSSTQRLEVNDVWFRYSDDDPWLLQGVSLAVDGEESIAITGKSGCGKSTLLRLMQGLLVPSRGSILLNGVPLSEVTGQYRAMIAAVQQVEELFCGTIAENIACFDSPLDMGRVQESAQKANIHAEIEAMQMKYNTLITDTGLSFSGGQKQRMLLARALYKAPRILFLDEATSHLDAETENRINRMVSTMGIARIVVAHRQETIVSCDRVLVLDDGRLNHAAQSSRTAG